MNAPLLLIRRRAAPADASGPPGARLVLAFDVRSRSRFRTRLEDGEEVGVILPRGEILRGGDRLRAEDGRIVEILAARETVTTAHAGEAALLARGAYHLGNRHVALQLGAHWLRYRHDHVLDAMLAGMGFELCVADEPFEPEAGAYHAHGDGHDHTHGDGHDNTHDDRRGRHHDGHHHAGHHHDDGHAHSRRG